MAIPMKPLDEAHIARLHTLLMDPRADESDVELILGILHKNTEDVTEHISTLIARFPNIVKQLHKLAGLVPDKEELAKEILVLLRPETAHRIPALLDRDDRRRPLEPDELLWGHGAQALGSGPPSIGRRAPKSWRFQISPSFGLKEIRDEQLKTGASDWLSWTSAIRALERSRKRSATMLCSIFSKGSPLNFLISECVQKLA